MSIRNFLLIFLAGLLLGVGLSPLASSKPEDALISPLTVSMADTGKYLSPLSEGEVLSAMQEPTIIAENNFMQLVSDPPATMSALEISRINKTVEIQVYNIQSNKKSSNISDKQGLVTITMIGDSMTDTMGPGLPYLEKELKKYYSNYQFNLLNYGAGGTNIEYGIQRLTNSYSYLGKEIPSLVSRDPDIVIIESFAYNPWGAEKSDLDRHWLAMAKIVDVVREQTNAKIIFASTIAPSKANFGAGPNGVNWSPDQAWEHAEKINLYLQNTINFANSQGYPLINAYQPSIVNNDGNLSYINPGDHIHPSVAGSEFFGSIAAKKLVDLGWIN